MTNAAAAAGKPFTILTYNVNFAGHGMDEAIAALRDAGADLVLLEETTPAWERTLRRALTSAYPYITFHNFRDGHHVAGGLAVLSRYPFDEKDYLPSPIGWFPALRIVAQTPLGAIQALVVHLHPPVTEKGNWALGWFTTGAKRLAEIERYYETLDPELPTVVAGDCNEDASGPAVSFLVEHGFQSSLPEAGVDDPTWHWYTKQLGELSWQLDHILHDRRLALVSARVIERGRSDHYPVVATFRYSGEQTPK